VRTNAFSGEQLAQENNRDPFAAPAWRSSVYHTPGWIIAVAQIARTLWAIGRFVARHPIADLVVPVLVTAWRLTGWSGPAALAAADIATLAVWRLRWPVSFKR
jgi:hypothetical protein